MLLTYASYLHMVCAVRRTILPCVGAKTNELPCACMGATSSLMRRPKTTNLEQDHVRAQIAPLSTVDVRFVFLVSSPLVKTESYKLLPRWLPCELTFLF